MRTWIGLAAAGAGFGATLLGALAARNEETATPRQNPSATVRSPFYSRQPTYPKDGESLTLTRPLDHEEGKDGASIDWKFTFKEDGDGQIPIFAGQACRLTCKGHVHTKHESCDTSCDEPCPVATGAGSKPHYMGVSTRLTELGAEGNGPPPRPHGSKLSLDFERFGMPSLLRGENVLGDNFPVGLREKIVLMAEASADHWNKTPCSSSTALFPAKKYILTVEYQLFAIEKGKRTDGPKGTIRYSVLIPVAGPLSFSEPEVNCRCEGTQTAPGHGSVPNRTATGAQHAWIEENGNRRTATYAGLTGYVQNVSCQNMNSATFTIAPMPTGRAYIPPGWELECLTGGGQNTQIVDGLQLGPPVDLSSLWTSLDPSGGRPDEKTVRTLCLQLHKPEPAPWMGYRLVPPKDPAIAALAEYTSTRRVRGPWDQVRLWIATDFASYDEIAEVLRPMVAPWSYLNELHRAADLGAVSPSDARLQKIMELRFALAERANPADAEWLMSEKARHDPSGTAKWIRGQASAVAALFDKGDPKEDAEQIGAAALGLASGGGPEGVEAAIWMLSQAIPPSQRALVASSEGAKGVAMLLISTSDERTATAVLGWLEAARPPITVFACANANPALPQALRDRANALAGGGRPLH